MKDLPIHIDQSSAPVYDCHDLISQSEDAGKLLGVVSNLPEVTATASNERDLLRAISTQFKAKIIEYNEASKEIPFQETQKPGPDQQQRWLPVHL